MSHALEVVVLRVRGGTKQVSRRVMHGSSVLHRL